MNAGHLLVCCALISNAVLWAQQHQDVVLLPAAGAEREEDWDDGISLLGVGRDLFLRRASFDFSAGFFRMRGYDPRERELVLNDVPLNDLYDGRPKWHILGGLTDITRGAEVFIGRAFTPHGFGRALGLQHIPARPSALRPGNRVTVSATNRSYQWRQMYTFNSGIGTNGLGLLLSFAHRSGTQGYFQGTSYASLAGFAGLEWQINESHSLGFSGLFNRYRRGQTAPLEEEVSALLGRRYNPNWGWSEGEPRPARQRLGSTPLISLRYRYGGKHSEVRAALAYHWGIQSRTRIAYFNGPNPNPIYYRNLPSYYFNRSAGPNFQNAARAEEAILARPQIDWDGLVQSNRTTFRDGRAVYLFTGEERRIREWAFRGLARFRPLATLRMDGGLEVRNAGWDFSTRILDLLGASYHLDEDPFTGTSNDVNGPQAKGEGDPIDHWYHLDVLAWNSYMQAQFGLGDLEVGMALKYGARQIRRIGIFQNERYPEESAGVGTTLRFSEWAIRAGLVYRLTGREWITAYFGMASRPPLPRDVYVNPRQHGRAFPQSENEKSHGASLNIHVRYPLLKGRVTGYFQQFQGGRSLRSYYTEAGFGSAFIREAVAGISGLHKGLEWGLEFQLNPALSLHFAGAWGQATYRSSPEIWLYTDPGPEMPEAFSDSGRLYAGFASMEGYPISGGPQKALSLGLGYRDPGYWWMDLRTVFLDGRVLGPALLRYADSFAGISGGDVPANPSVSGEASSPDPDHIANARMPERLPPVYLLNLSLGKSWLKGGHYVSAFLGINNLFDLDFKTGGYQQGRLATLDGLMQDQRSGRPSFGPKYYHGYGRTYFINLSWSF